MIKSSLIQDEDVYPRLMETKPSAPGVYVVVMFEAPCVGMIVHSANQERAADVVGYSSNDFDMSQFRTFHGKIELGGTL